MTWRNAVASIKLVEEINLRYPNRSKINDGTIGDAAHQSRKSDHNPWVKDRYGVGVVRARDIDEDLLGPRPDKIGGLNSIRDRLLYLARSGDPRLRNGGYVIYEGLIYSEKSNFTARPYNGLNAHKQHLHVSLSRDPEGYDSDAPWGIATDKPRSFKFGDRGQEVVLLVLLLNILAEKGFTIDTNGSSARLTLKLPTNKDEWPKYTFDEQVTLHVKRFQRFLNKLWLATGRVGPEPKIDGIAGPMTQSAIKFWLPVEPR